MPKLGWKVKKAKVSKKVHYGSYGFSTKHYREE